MYKDVISYELAEGISEEHLVRVARKVLETWMNKLPGFIKWEIHRNRDGSYTDIVYWYSEADTSKAEKEMANIHDAGEWYACYKNGSITSKNLTPVVSF